MGRPTIPGEITPEAIKTAGYYKVEGDELLHAPNRVTTPTDTLTKESYSTPKDLAAQAKTGWRWFDTREAAVAALNFAGPGPDLTCVVEDCADRIEVGRVPTDRLPEDVPR